MRRLNNSNELKIGAFLSYVQTGAQILVALLYTPVMLRILGQNEYGLYNTISSTISMLSVLSLGFSNAYIRFYARYKVNEEKEKIERLNGLFLLVYLIIGIIAFLCGRYLSFNLKLVFDEGLTAEELEKAKIMMILLALNLGISFPMSTFTSYINAHERFSFIYAINIVKIVCSPFVQIPLLLMGFGAVGMTAVIFAFNMFVNLAEVIYSIKKLNFRMKLGHWEKGLFKSLFLFSSLIAINVIVDQVNNSLDSVLLGRFCGTAEVAVYSIGATFCGYYTIFSTSISTVFIPRIHKIVNSVQDKLEQNRQLTEIFIKVGRIQYLVLALVCSGFIVFGRAFIALWAGEGYEASYWVALCRMVPATVALIQNAGIEIQRAKNVHQYRAYSMIVMALVNLVLTIFLCQRWGAVGASAATGIAAILCDLFLLNWFYYKKTGINVFRFWKNILRQSAGLIVPCICGFFIARYASMQSYITLALWIVVYAAVYVLNIWFLSMNRSEKDLVLGVVNRFTSKLKKKGNTQ